MNTWIKVARYQLTDRNMFVVLIISGRDDWHSVGHFFTTLTIGGLTALLAALTAVLLAGGYATVRRLTV